MNEHLPSHTVYAPYEKPEYHPAQRYVAPPKVPTRIDEIEGCYPPGTACVGMTTLWMLAVVAVGIVACLAYLRGCA